VWRVGAGTSIESLRRLNYDLAIGGAGDAEAKVATKSTICIFPDTCTE